MGPVPRFAPLDPAPLLSSTQRCLTPSQKCPGGSKLIHPKYNFCYCPPKPLLTSPSVNQLHKGYLWSLAPRERAPRLCIQFAASLNTHTSCFGVSPDPVLCSSPSPHPGSQRHLLSAQCRGTQLCPKWSLLALQSDPHPTATILLQKLIRFCYFPVQNPPQTSRYTSSCILKAPRCHPAPGPLCGPPPWPDQCFPWSHLIPPSFRALFKSRHRREAFSD